MKSCTNIFNLAHLFNRKRLYPESSKPAQQGASALAFLGERDRAKEYASRALAIDPDDVLIQYNNACTYCLLGKLDRALDMLVALLPRANHETKAWILHASDFDSLHNHPRWQKMLELAE